MKPALAILFLVLASCASKPEAKTPMVRAVTPGPRWITEFDTNALPLTITPVPFITARVAAPKLTSIGGSVPMTVNASVVWQG